MRYTGRATDRISPNRRRNPIASAIASEIIRIVSEWWMRLVSEVVAACSDESAMARARARLSS